MSTPPALRDPNVNATPFVTWRSALLGAAVGIAGPAYFGTLLTNIAVRIVMAHGHTMREAYDHLGYYDFSPYAMVGFAIAVLSALGCGWVSAAHGCGTRVAQGLVAGLLAASFPVLMLLGPGDRDMPLLFVALSLVVPVVGSLVGAMCAGRRDR